MGRRSVIDVEVRGGKKISRTIETIVHYTTLARMLRADRISTLGSSPFHTSGVPIMAIWKEPTSQKNDSNAMSQSNNDRMDEVPAASLMSSGLAASLKWTRRKGVADCGRADDRGEDRGDRPYTHGEGTSRAM